MYTRLHKFLDEISILNELTIPKFNIGLGNMTATALNELSICLCNFFAMSPKKLGMTKHDFFSPLLCCFVSMNLSIE